MNDRSAIADRERVYRATRQPELAQVPPTNFVMIDGAGDPNTATSYQAAVEALYAVSYSLKFALAKETGQTFRVGPLEGLWWVHDMTLFDVAHKDDWQWTMMIAQPDLVTSERFAQARLAVARKKTLPALDRARLSRLDEGLCAQILHIGPYSAEGPTVAALHAFIGERGLHYDGRHQKHHEIYLGDPRRGAPEKLKTIIRQPVSED